MIQPMMNPRKHHNASKSGEIKPASVSVGEGVSFLLDGFEKGGGFAGSFKMNDRASMRGKHATGFMRALLSKKRREYRKRMMQVKDKGHLDRASSSSHMLVPPINLGVSGNNAESLFFQRAFLMNSRESSRAGERLTRSQLSARTHGVARAAVKIMGLVQKIRKRKRDLRELQEQQQRDPRRVRKMTKSECVY